MTIHYANGVDPCGQPLELFVEEGTFVAPTGAASRIDLKGATVVPGFVDAHCHIIPMGLDLLKLNLSPCRTREEVLQAVSDWHSRNPEGWLLAVQYDQTKFDDARHLTRDELDAVVNDRPVLLRHSNGHASVANTKALEAGQISESVADPSGGTFVRDDSGRLTGVLLERAHEFVTAASPEPTLEDMTEAVLRACEEMSLLGVTCASDMMTGRWNLEKELLAYHIASQQRCKVRLRLYAQWSAMFGPRRLAREVVDDICQGMDSSVCRLDGVKIFADGAIGSATAAIYGKYLTTGGNGQLIYSPDKLRSMVKVADEAGCKIAIHTIGDRSTDHVMDAIEQCDDPSRHRIEHAMILSDAQIARMTNLNPLVTMQPEFLLRFGHTYAKQLGPEAAKSIKRCRSVLDAGLRLSFSSDRPIVPGDPWDGMTSAFSRPAGFDPAEAVTKEEALRLYTKESAIANGDADSMGTLEPGYYADFQIYDRWGKGSLRSVYKGGQPVTGTEVS